MAKVYWTKRDGTQISVDDMTIEHLKNTLKMIIRNNPRVELAKITKLRVLPIFNINGEMAQASIEDNMDDERDGPDEGDGPDWDQGCRD